MIIFYEIPIIFILFVVLGFLGMDISFIVEIIKWLIIIGGIFGIFLGIRIGLEYKHSRYKILSLLTIIFSIALIILFITFDNYIEALGSFNLYDIFRIIKD